MPWSQKHLTTRARVSSRDILYVDEYWCDDEQLKTAQLTNDDDTRAAAEVRTSSSSTPFSLSLSLHCSPSHGGCGAEEVRKVTEML